MEADRHTAAKPPPSRPARTGIEYLGLNSKVPEVGCRGLTLSQSTIAGGQGHDIGAFTLMGLGVGLGDTPGHGIAGHGAGHTLIR